MKTVCALPRRLSTRSRNVSNVMYPSPSIASAFSRRVAELVHYFLGVALEHTMHTVLCVAREAIMPRPPKTKALDEALEKPQAARQALLRRVKAYSPSVTSVR